MMVEVKTADLTGPALDWAVAKAERVTLSEASWRYQLEVHGCIVTPQRRELRYSTDWSQGGPLIEKFQVAYLRDGPDYVAICHEVEATGFGQTHLIAACRAIVAAKLGPTVSVPADLMQGAEQK